MNYINTIKTAIIIFPFIALLFTIPFILHQYHKYGSINKLRVLIIYSFILYMITIYFLVILPLPSRNSVVPKKNMIHLIPFGFINDFLSESNFVLSDPSTYLNAIKHPSFYTVAFNILMTIPFGMYLRYYFKCSFKKTFILSLTLSLFFEMTQITGLYFIYPYPYRVFDVDDLITNTLGGVLGYLIIGIFIRHLPTRDELDEKSRTTGEVVSGLRRVTVFCLDMFIYLFISLFCVNNYIRLTIFIIYYIICPLCMNGKTLGSKFLNVRLEFTRYKFIKCMLRIIFLYIYYFAIPFGLMFVSYIAVQNLNLEATYSIYFYVIIMFIIFMFYMINIFTILIKKKIFYDKLFKVNYKSTINENKLSKANLEE